MIGVKKKIFAINTQQACIMTIVKMKFCVANNASPTSARERNKCEPGLYKKSWIIAIKNAPILKKGESYVIFAETARKHIFAFSVAGK